MSKISEITIDKNTTIKEAMIVMTSAGPKKLPTGIVIVTGKNNKLLGVVTDGDIRRALLKGKTLNDPVENIMITNPVHLKNSENIKNMSAEIISQIELANKEGRIRSKKVNQILLINEDGTPQDIISFYDIWKLSNIKTKRVCIVGTGYVGLTLSLVLADKGFKVIGYDTDKYKIEQLSKGNLTFYERGIDSLLTKHIHNNFQVTNKLVPDMAEIYIISVGTPVNNKNKPELHMIESAAKSLAKVIKKGDSVIVRSTVPVGTCRNTILPILEKESGLICGIDFYLAFAPERTIEGKAIEELNSLPQIIGAYDTTSLSNISDFFRKLSPHIVSTNNLEEAEMAKLINNTFRDISFAFSNELALICAEHNMDVDRVVKAANDGYKRNKIPFASPGVGGLCLRKDPYIYSNASKDTSILALAARKINDKLPHHVANKIEQFSNKTNKTNPKIFLLGLAFKGQPETSDLRDSTSIDIFNILKQKGFKNIYGYDPIANPNELKQLGINTATPEEGFKDADIVAILNNHKKYMDLDINSLIKTSNKPLLFLDTWHIFTKESISQDNVFYSGLSFDQF
jgi:nucleotide sugar dehydrogenase